MVDFAPSARGPAAAVRRGTASLRFALSAPLLLLVWIYRRMVSPVLPPSCRYYPSCSKYAEEALRAKGPVLGTWLAVRRLLRCHPWSAGGFDFVPGSQPGTASPSMETGSLPVGASAQRNA
jgi:putative membrane protein insertion efficiency factor